MIENYRIVKGPSGYNVEGFFNVTYRRNFWDRLFRMHKGLYGWHLLDLFGRKWEVYMGIPVIPPAAVFKTEAKAREFIDWQKQRGEIIAV